MIKNRYDHRVTKADYQYFIAVLIALATTVISTFVF